MAEAKAPAGGCFFSLDDDPTSGCRAAGERRLDAARRVRVVPLAPSHRSVAGGRRRDSGREGCPSSVAQHCPPASSRVPFSARQKAARTMSTTCKPSSGFESGKPRSSVHQHVVPADEFDDDLRQATALHFARLAPGKPISRVKSSNNPASWSSGTTSVPTADTQCPLRGCRNDPDSSMYICCPIRRQPAARRFGSLW